MPLTVSDILDGGSGDVQRVREMAYGPIVGEHTPATLFGPDGHLLEPDEVAASPDTGFRQGDVIYDGETFRRVGDKSYVRPGVPTSHTIELRDKPDQGVGLIKKVSVDDILGRAEPLQASPNPAPAPVPAPEPEVSNPRQEEIRPANLADKLQLMRVKAQEGLERVESLGASQHPHEENKDYTTEDVRRFFRSLPGAKTARPGVEEGIANGMADLVHGLVNPDALPQLAAWMFAAPVMAPAYAGSRLLSLPEQYGRLKDAINSGSKAKVAKVITQEGVSDLMAASAGAHFAKSLRGSEGVESGKPETPVPVIEPKATRFEPQQLAPVTRTAIRRVGDGKVFAAEKPGEPHFLIPNDHPEAKDYLGGEGYKRYEEGFVDEQGNFLNREEALDRQKDVGAAPEDFKTEYRDELNATELAKSQSGEKVLPRAVKVAPLPDEVAHSDLPHLNVGLDIGDNKNALSFDRIRDTLKGKYGRQVVAIRRIDRGDEEHAADVVIDRPLSPSELHDFSADLQQQAVAQLSGDILRLGGPQRANYGSPNPDFFEVFDRAGKPVKLSDLLGRHYGEELRRATKGTQPPVGPEQSEPAVAPTESPAVRVDDGGERPSGADNVEPSRLEGRSQPEAPQGRGAEAEKEGSLGTSNRAFEAIYGPNEIIPGIGKSAEQLLQEGRTRLERGTDPYEVASRARQAGSISAEDYAVLSAEHDRLYRDAMDAAAFAERHPTVENAERADRLYKHAHDFAQEVLQPHKTAASDLFRAMQSVEEPRLDSMVGIKDYMQKRLGREMRESEVSDFKRRVREITALGEKEGQSLVEAANRVGKRLARVERVSLDEAGRMLNEKIREATKDCLLTRGRTLEEAATTAIAA